MTATTYEIFVPLFCLAFAGVLVLLSHRDARRMDVKLAEDARRRRQHPAE